MQDPSSTSLKAKRTGKPISGLHISTMKTSELKKKNPNTSLWIKKPDTASPNFAEIFINKYQS